MKEDNFDAPAPASQEENSIVKQVNVNTNEAEKKLIQKAINDKNTIQKNRAVFERQWLVNIAFLYGKHYFSIERSPKPGLEERIVWELKQLERSKKTRRTVNYILPLYRSLLARMIQLKQRINVEPATRTDRDISAARVGQEALEDFWQNANKTNPILCQQYAGMLSILTKLFSYMLICGQGYLKPWFNPQTKAKVVFPNLNNDMMMAQVGNVEVEVEHPFNIFADPMGHFKVQKKILPVEYINALYGVQIKPEEVGLSDVERQLTTLLEGGIDDKYKDAAEFYERWQLPSEAAPEGEFYICSKEKVIVPPGPIPAEFRGRIPFFEFRYLDVLFAQPQGVIEQLIPSQEEYNHTVSRLHEYKKWMNGKILVPDKCNLQTKYDDQVGQLIKYDASGGKPAFDTPPGAPSFILREIDRIRRDMEDIAAVHDNYNQRASGSGKSGQAIENLSEIDNTQLSPQLLHIEQQLEFFSETVLDIMEAKYSLPRLINIAGQDLTSEVRMFKGSQVAGNRRIKISLGSSLPFSREARQQVIMALADKGYITKERAIELLEFGDIDGVYRSIDDQAEKTEIQEMLKGIVVEPMSWENHARRIKVLTDYMMSDEFVQLRKEAEAGNPDAQAVAQNFMQHRQKHQDYLSQEMQAAGVPTGKPTPSPAPPAPPAA